MKEKKIFHSPVATIIPVVRIENLPCTLYNKVCQANVILTRRLSPGKYYDFLVTVSDSKGETNAMRATISVTNGTTPSSQIFLHKPSLIMVPEVSNTKILRASRARHLAVASLN